MVLMLACAGLLAAFFLLAYAMSGYEATIIEGAQEDVPSWEVHAVLESARQITREAAA